MTDDTTPWRQLSPAGKITFVRAGAADGLSYAGIAARHGTTRSAVAGVASRARALGPPIVFRIPAIGGRGSKPKVKPKRARKVRPPKVTLPRERTVAMPKTPPRHQGLTAMLPIGPPLPAEALYKPPASAWAALEGTTPARIEDHTCGCRWPIGDPARYCNAPVRDTSVYCPTHSAMAYQPLPPKKTRPTARPR